MLLLFTSIFILLLVAFSIGIYNRIKIGYASKKWVKTQGMVINRKNIIERSMGDVDYYFYRLILEIEFTFNGIKYICTDIHCDKELEFMTEKEANNFLKFATIGNVLVIYINPKNPKQSAIFKSENPGINLLPIFPILILFALSYILAKHLF